MSRLHSERRFNDDSEFRQNVLINMASIMDSRFGRPSAFVYDGTDYESTKEIIFDNIMRKKHVSEDDITNAELVLLDGINMNNQRWERLNPPKEPMIVQRRSPPAERRKRKVPTDVIKDYRAAVDSATKELDSKLCEYERDPESHPFYRKEWELFWNRKVDEMNLRGGGDPKDCNFHDDWCEFFVNRMRELHKQEVEWKEGQIMRKFSLEKQDIVDEAEAVAKRAKVVDENPFIDRKGRFNIDEIDDDEDDDEDYELPANKGVTRLPKEVVYQKEAVIMDEFVRKYGDELGWAHGSSHKTLDDSRNQSQSNKNQTQNEAKHKNEPQRNQHQASTVKKSQNPLSLTTTITTCRLLSTLESELGLLAPKIIDLLSKSLAYEREKAKSSDELLFDNENLNLIETAKEKIIGLQSANLLATNKVPVVKKAVTEIEKLLEKHEIMLKIKASLRDMGKTEASTEEIDMLMNMFQKKDVNCDDDSDKHRNSRFSN